MAFAMIFPGQASQYVGMMASIANEHPSVIEDFQVSAPTETCTKTLHVGQWCPGIGRGLWAVMGRGGSNNFLAQCVCVCVRVSVCVCVCVSTLPIARCRRLVL